MLPLGKMLHVIALEWITPFSSQEASMFAWACQQYMNMVERQSWETSNLRVSQGTTDAFAISLELKLSRA